MENLELTNSLIAVTAVAGLGGLIGGMVAGRRGTVVASILMGILGGGVAAVLIEAADLANPIPLGQYSAAWAFAGGAVISYLVAFTNK